MMGEALVSWDAEIAGNRMPRLPWSLPFPVWSWGSGCDPRSLPSTLTVKGTPYVSHHRPGDCCCVSQKSARKLTGFLVLP